MITEILKDAILQNIGPLKQAPKGWQKSCCKLCHTQGHGKDTRNRFGIQFNPQSIAMNCFNCGFSAGYSEGKELSKSFKFFLKHIGVDSKFIDQIDFEIFKEKNQIKVVREGDESTLESFESKMRTLFSRWQPMELPKDSLSIKQWLEAGLTDKNFLNVATYLVDRKLYNIDDFYWSPLKEHNINQRLIIPYYYRNKTVGYTARLCYDTDNKSIPKYYQQCPTDFVYNLDHQQSWMRKYVIVNEGVIDAYITDGVAVLGEITQPKIDIINRLQKQVIVCPDGDKKGRDMIDAAIANNWAVSFPKWKMKFKDASAAMQKYGSLLTVSSIISSAITNSTKIDVAWKLDQNERDRRHPRN